MLKSKLNLFNVLVLLIVSLYLPPASEVFAEEDRLFLFLRFERKWTSKVFAQSYTVSYEPAFILEIPYIETGEEEREKLHYCSQPLSSGTVADEVYFRQRKFGSCVSGQPVYSIVYLYSRPVKCWQNLHKT